MRRKVERNTAQLKQIVVFAGIVGFGFAVGLQTVRSEAKTIFEYFDTTENACYGRVYSKAHLAKHPNQRVKSILIKSFPQAFKVENNVDRDGTPKQVYLSLDVMLRNSSKLFEESAICEKRGQHFYCGIECDGGGFDLLARTGGKILLKTAKYGFRVVAGGGCDGDIGEENYKRITLKSDDKAFLLSALPAAQCVEPPK